MRRLAMSVGGGKTKLAVEVAGDVADSFLHGVSFVELAQVSDSGLLGQAIAGALDLELPGADIDGLAGYLAGRHALLVLDNWSISLTPAVNSSTGCSTAALVFMCWPQQRGARAGRGTNISCDQSIT